MELETLNNFKQIFNEMKLNYSRNALLETGLSSSKGDDVDLALEDRENLLLLKLQGRENFFLKNIEAALLRIENGEFGLCEECGGEIELPRLQARPTTRFCISCKEEQEREEGHIPYQKKSHTHGQSINNSNIAVLPIRNEEIGKEKVLQFNKIRLNVGLRQ